MCYITLWRDEIESIFRFVLSASSVLLNFNNMEFKHCSNDSLIVTISSFLWKSYSFKGISLYYFFIFCNAVLIFLWTSKQNWNCFQSAFWLLLQLYSYDMPPESVVQLSLETAFPRTKKQVSFFFPTSMFFSQQVFFFTVFYSSVQQAQQVNKLLGAEGRQYVLRSVVDKILFCQVDS